MRPFFAVLLTLGCSGALCAQQPATAPELGVVIPSEMSAVPVDQEPRHHLVFANDFVRIIDAVFPGFYVSQNHTHSADHVTVVIAFGRDDAQAQARVGFAGFAKGGYTHVVTNPAPGAMRFIDVELRGADRGGGDEEQQPAHVVVLNNARVRIMRVKLESGQSVGAHRHANGYVSVTVRGADGPGAWRWHPSADPGAALEAGKQPMEIVEIEPK